MKMSAQLYDIMIYLKKLESHTHTHTHTHTQFSRKSKGLIMMTQLQH